MTSPVWLPAGSTVADALNAADFTPLPSWLSVLRVLEMCAHLRVLDCSGVTYLVGDAFSQLDEGAGRSMLLDEAGVTSSAAA